MDQHDAEFRALTLRDAQFSLHHELENLIRTALPGQEKVWTALKTIFFNINPISTNGGKV